MKNNVSGISPKDAGERIKTFGHTPIIELDFDTGVAKGSIISHTGFSKQPHIKSIVNANNTYSLHHARNTEELVDILEQIKAGNASQSIDKILIKIGGGVKPLKECLVSNTAQGKQAIYGALASRASQDFRHSSTTTNITRLDWPKITLFDPMSEYESVISPEGVTKPQHPCLLVAVPCLKFENPDDRQYASSTFHRDGLPNKIHWIVPSELSVAKPVNLLSASVPKIKQPQQMSLGL